MKIDFDKLEVYTNLAHTQCTVVRMRKPLAEALYQQGTGIACHALALKLWNTEGATELTQEECNIITKLVERSCTPAVIDSVRAAISHSSPS